MSGASPGGVAVLAVVPSLDLVFAAFGNAPQALALHDELLLWLIRQQVPVSFPPLEPIQDRIAEVRRDVPFAAVRVDVESSTGASRSR
jgi:hypothetical protein